ncbi:hypothetical protein [Tianweitania sediminis]|uniref:Sce7726 family protein n=1 Tax=Tianweitania sediminis TaxID=1502156 RepID=A0A8J7R121_9HYPH|nr:hypothetical protein [Tianweitania sediminis]MBP0440663.1 hypothetical protein [Tianweitania sediminis]
MNPFVSKEENQIRTATVDRIRTLLPDARIIHELNVDEGHCRADIAAVTELQIFLFELKSSKDTLGRLANQIRTFHPVCHGLVVVADEKWCGRATAAGYPNCDARKVLEASGTTTQLWQYPEPQAAFPVWRLPVRIHYPWPWKMLRLLSAEEIKAVCAERGIRVPSRTNRSVLIDTILHRLTGTEIEQAVCAQLRSRQESDPALIGEVAA